MLIVLTALLSAVLRCSAFRSRSSYKRRTSTAVVNNSTHGSTKHKDNLVNSYPKRNRSEKSATLHLQAPGKFTPKAHKETPAANQSIPDRSRLESQKTRDLLYSDQTKLLNASRNRHAGAFKCPRNKLFPPSLPRLSSDMTLSNTPSANSPLCL